MMLRPIDDALPRVLRKKKTGAAPPAAASFDTVPARWKAVEKRDPAADGAFFYAVRTTGIYCRPTCRSRRPRRENVAFYRTWADAEAAGFRACRKCCPREGANQTGSRLVVDACRRIESAESPPSLAELAAAAGLSPSHFHRLFKRLTGVTPKAYATEHRADRVRGQLAHSSSATEAIFAAGFGSTSRFYEKSARLLGMTPKAFRQGGAGTEIRYAIGRCWLGSILVAATEHGVCAIQLGDDPAELVQALAERFPHAKLLKGGAAFEKTVARVIAFVDDPCAGFDLPLDLRGTAFQLRVWQALGTIPAGQTLTYAQLATRLGQPSAVRAVAQACGANPVAVAIPCHRVVRTGGGLGGYRWGIELKDKLLRREGAAAKAGPRGR
jgi:AraC family transcriptional regulator, regulatory protein of adaptative response / methylated-DNA-[protein]-cysteine methyltransferase